MGEMTAGSKAGSEVTTGAASTEKRVEKVADAFVLAFVDTTARTSPAGKAPGRRRAGLQGHLSSGGKIPAASRAAIDPRRRTPHGAARAADDRDRHCGGICDGRRHALRRVYVETAV